MAEPILGPAWPAILAPGLRVCYGATNDAGTVVSVAPLLVCWDGPLAIGDDDPITRPTPDVLRIDYADPATRDAVCRALAPGLRNPARFVPFGDRRWGLTTDEVEFGGWPRVWRPTPQGDAPVAPGLAGLSGPPDVQWALALRAVAAAVWGGE